MVDKQTYLEQCQRQAMELFDRDMTVIGSDDGGDHGHDAHAHHVLTLLGFIIPVAILMLYLTIGSWMETKHFCFGHETGVIILIGMLISTVIACVKDDIGFLEWNNDLFFDILLPLIIFTTGYNIRRRKFFGNFVNISKFGLLGTFLTFVFYFGFTYGLFQLFTMTKYSRESGQIETWHLDAYSIAYMCAILTGSDIIAAVTLVKFDD